MATGSSIIAALLTQVRNVFGRCSSVIYGMGVAKGLLTGKEGEKNNPVTLLLYPTEETTVRQEHRRGWEATSRE